MNIGDVLARVICMIPGQEARYAIADETVTLFDRSTNLSRIRCELQDEFSYFELKIICDAISDGSDNYTIKIEPQRTYNFVVHKDISCYELDSSDAVDEFITDCSEIIKQQILRGEVHAAQTAMFAHLNECWPEVVADLVLADLYNPPIDDRIKK